MINDIITSYTNTGAVWESSQAKNKTTSGEFKTKFDKAVRTDTVEFSRATAPNNNFALIKAEKSNIASELADVHTDVNKFLEIKDQVKSGTYELNASDIAKGIMNYSIY